MGLSGSMVFVINTLCFVGHLSSIWGLLFWIWVKGNIKHFTYLSVDRDGDGLADDSFKSNIIQSLNLNSTNVSIAELCKTQMVISPTFI